jgi:enamine deaminase RidA (YjgF/YER057c/UK114 family)
MVQAMQAREFALAETKTYINPGTLVKTEGISHAVQMGRIVWVSGQVGLDNRGRVVGDNVRAQAVQAFRNLDAVLDIARATPRDVMKLDIAIVGFKPEDMAMLREVAPRYFPGIDAPATTVVGVSSLSREGLLIAVSGMAMLRFAPQDTIRAADSTRRRDGEQP